MFRFKSLELMNWDCYPYYRVPLDGDIILLVGPNGSGKTTFLDALRVLMNGQRLSKGRTLHHYIQKDVEVAMIKGVVTNDIVGTRRPFANMGIYGDGDVSLICVIRNHGADRIEKEYFILKGDVPVDQIKGLKTGLRPLQYSKYLEDAGVSRSTLKLIALEQGQTDKIGQLSPGDLLQLVMDITGNRDIIKRYEDARSNYRRSSQQLIELRSEYNKICQQTQQLQQQAKEAQTFKELTTEKQVIEQEKLPLARWYFVLNQIAGNEKSFLDIQQKKIELEKRIQATLQQQQIFQGKLANIEQEQQNIRTQQTQQEQELNKLHQQIGQCQSEWQRLDALRQECENIPDDLEPVSVQKQLEKAKEGYYKNKNKCTQAQELLENLRQEKDRVGSKKLPSFPREVEEFRKILQENKIEHILFAEGLEITNPKWQLAIEAFLGRERFSILVDSKDFLAAKRLGEKYRYSFYISPFDATSLPAHTKPNSILANIRAVDPRITGRLLGLNEIILVDSIEEGHSNSKDVTITVKGYRQDRRGGIFIARDVKFYCGGLAIERQINELEEEISEHEKEIQELQDQLRVYENEIKEAELHISLLKRRGEWLVAKERFETLKKQGEQLLTSSRQLESQRRKTSVEYDSLSEERSNITAEQKELQREKERLERDRSQIDDNISDKQQILHQLRWQKEELERQIPIAGRDSYTPDKLESIDWLEKKLQELTQSVERFIGCKDIALIPLYEHERKELEMKQLQLERQEKDQQQRTQELDLCRKDYKDMIEETVKFYNEAVKDLAVLAGCKMRVFLEWGNGESLIDDAKLYVKISFDQKYEVDIHDKSLSGGQDVIASLILLIALSRIEQERGSGFFIMDEHNAHLDMLRIMEVGKFLRSTKAQFVLTTPTTENVAALTVADLIMTFSKRNSESRYASKPRYIRKM